MCCKYMFGVFYHMIKRQEYRVHIVEEFVLYIGWNHFHAHGSMHKYAGDCPMSQLYCMDLHVIR